MERPRSTGSVWGQQRRAAALAAAMLVLAAAAQLGTLGCGSSLPQRVRVAGVAAYSPVPSDALPVRRADTDALTQLTAAVQGLRYTRAAGEFSLAPAAFSAVQPHEPLVARRDVARVGDVRIFWVEAEADARLTYSPEQVRELERATRLTVTFHVDLPSPEATSDSEARAHHFVERVRRARHRAITRGLETLYGEAHVPAHGRVFLLAVDPELTLDDEPLPRDPAPLGLRKDEYRYRSGQGLVSPDPTRLTLQLALWILPDVPLH